MDEARTRLKESLDLLESIRPFVNTGVSPKLFEAAWEKAMGEVVIAARAYVGTDPLADTMPGTR